MVAEPLPSAPESVSAPGPCFAARVAALRDDCVRLWQETPEEMPVLGPRTGWRRHVANARAARQLIDRLAGELERVPTGEAERRAWREAVRDRLQRFGDERLGWPAGYRRLVFADHFYDASVAFAREARAFDPGLPLASLWQALRNVWIGNSLQMALDLHVTLNPGLFAYSMLYPLTDNLLDDPRVESGAKRAFNERFGRRLAGQAVWPAGAADRAVFRLVERIEQEFPRRAHPDVHQSLLAIHHGQVLSLTQQDDPRLAGAEILAISCEKGGTSVLADLHLVAGNAAAAAERFAFGYGVALQLLDDLQDVETDLGAGHQTLFTRAARRGVLDRPAARLARFLDRVLDGEPLLDGPGHADRKDLIRRNCRMLLAGAVAEQPHRFSRRFRGALARQWPIGFRAMNRLRRRAARRYRLAAARRHPGGATASLLDDLLTR